MATPDFRFLKTPLNFHTQTLEKASATVIERGDMVAIDAGGLAIKGTAASTALAIAVAAAGDGETEVVVVNDPTASIVYEGTADANFAKANRGTEVDMVVNAGAQQIDLGASATDVFKILPGTDAGTVGAATNVRFRINKPL